MLRKKSIYSQWKFTLLQGFSCWDRAEHQITLIIYHCRPSWKAAAIKTEVSSRFFVNVFKKLSHNLEKGLPETIGVNAFNLKCCFNYQLVLFSKAFFYLEMHIGLLLWQLDHLLAMHINNSDSKYVMFPVRFLMESEMFYLAKLWRIFCISFGRLMTLKNSESVYKERIGGNITYEQFTVTMLFLCLFGSIICQI